MKKKGAINFLQKKVVIKDSVTGKTVTLAPGEGIIPSNIMRAFDFDIKDGSKVIVQAGKRIAARHEKMLKKSEMTTKLLQK